MKKYAFIGPDRHEKLQEVRNANASAFIEVHEGNGVLFVIVL
jgi:hypothetical protein